MSDYWHCLPLTAAEQGFPTFPPFPPFIWRRLPAPLAFRGRRHDAHPPERVSSASNHRWGWPWRQSFCGLGRKSYRAL